MARLTFGGLRDEIADDIGRTDVNNKIETAINRAISLYQGRKFWFMEDTVNFSLSASQEYYSLGSGGLPANVAYDKYMRISNGNAYYPLTKRDDEWIDNVSQNQASIGMPSDYSFIRNSFRFYPFPDQGRTVQLRYEKNQSTLSSSADTNDWLDDSMGLNLIKAAARLSLAINVTYDTDDRDTQSIFVKEELIRLINLTRKKKSTGEMQGDYY